METEQRALFRSLTLLLTLEEFYAADFRVRRGYVGLESPGRDLGRRTFPSMLPLLVGCPPRIFCLRFVQGRGRVENDAMIARDLLNA